MAKIETLDALETIYGVTGNASIIKEIGFVHDYYRKLIEAAPFAALATVGPEGLDCSPRGDRKGELVRIVDPKTLMMPDRRGNNRLDSLKNIIRDPRIALMFLIPGHGNALRVNGRAYLDNDVELCTSFAVDGHMPRTVIVIQIDAIYFQCARAIVRSALWDPKQFIDSNTLPTPGQILEHLSTVEFDGKAYDTDWPERAARTMW